MTLPTPTETVNLAELYDQEVMPWSRAAEALARDFGKAETACWLGTVRPDGRPHAASIGAIEHDGALYFVTGARTRKGINLAANPACTIAVRLDGIDVVFEGEAHRVSDAPTLEAVAAHYRDTGWPATVEGDAFTAPYSAQSAGPPPWNLYRFAPDTAFGVGLREPHGASRWRF